MPRSRPLSNVASARSSPADYQEITPRTPRLRSGRVEEEIELEQVEDYDDGSETSEHQTLLLSSASDGFPLSRSRDRGNKLHTETRKGKGRESILSVALSRLPLIAGVLLAGFLLVLAFLSFKNPDALSRYFDISAPANEKSPISGSYESNTTKPSPSHNVLSYQNYTNFPLLPSEYRAECNKLHTGYMSHGSYWEPNRMGVLDVVHHDDEHDYKLPEGQHTAVCTSTITYMLDGKVGLLADLALMAQAAALARERNRTFLVDDTYWNRGKWMDHFQDVRARQPGPEHGCRAPPPEELVACPRLARHWVINSRTAKFHFGPEFSNHYEDPYARQLNRLKPIFDATLDSFREIIRPNAENAAFIYAARVELAQVASQRHGTLDPYIAVHIRRGDRRPSSYSFPGNHIPMADFANAVDDTWSRLHPYTAKVVYVASDAPSALLEFSNLSSTRRTFSLSQSKDPQLRTLASPAEYWQSDFNESENSLRILATRGAIVDFALISGMWAWGEEIVPDAVVCAISSNICKLSAIGLGWDKAFGIVNETGHIDDNHKRWVDIDEKGQVVPIWKPFELFP